LLKIWKKSQENYLNFAGSDNWQVEKSFESDRIINQSIFSSSKSNFRGTETAKNIKTIFLENYENIKSDDIWLNLKLHYSDEGLKYKKMLKLV
jgi:hypothetical protein